MEPVDLSDPDLLAQLIAAAEDVQLGSDPEQRRDAWHRVTTLLREFERRYPPS